MSGTAVLGHSALRKWSSSVLIDVADAATMLCSDWGVRSAVGPRTAVSKANIAVLAGATSAKYVAPYAVGDDGEAADEGATAGDAGALDPGDPADPVDPVDPVEPIVIEQAASAKAQRPTAPAKALRFMNPPSPLPLEMLPAKAPRFRGIRQPRQPC